MFERIFFNAAFFCFPIRGVLAALVFAGVVFLAQAEDWQPKTFQVKITGRGPAVLLIPGLACSGDVWNATVAHLQDRYECHVINLKGFGGVPPMEALPAPLLSAVRDEIIAYIRGRGMDHPILIGHSLGGMLALDIAKTAPDLPRRLVVVDSSPFLAGTIQPEVKPEAVRTIASGLRQKMSGMTREEFEASQRLVIRTLVNAPENGAYLADMANKSDQRTVTEALAELFLADIRPELVKIKCPALVILAVADRVAFRPPEEIEANFRGQYAGLSEVKLLLFEKARHFLMYDEPEKFFAALDAALGGP
ncbi:MAG TPA: alpha/beta hydrolase [Chthoniobacterales bacterium]